MRDILTSLGSTFLFGALTALIFYFLGRAAVLRLLRWLARMRVFHIVSGAGDVSAQALAVFRSLRVPARGVSAVSAGNTPQTLVVIRAHILTLNRAKSRDIHNRIRVGLFDIAGVQDFYIE